jgi:hypothetical protein
LLHKAKLELKTCSVDKYLYKEDFPAFGLPIIATVIPSFIIFPLSKEFFNFIKSLLTSSSVFLIFLFVTSATSYSG